MPAPDTPEPSSEVPSTVKMCSGAVPFLLSTRPVAPRERQNACTAGICDSVAGTM
jgi:hypothetical protein